MRQLISPPIHEGQGRHHLLSDVAELHPVPGLDAKVDASMDEEIDERRQGLEGMRIQEGDGGRSIGAAIGSEQVALRPLLPRLVQPLLLTAER